MNQEMEVNGGQETLAFVSMWKKKRSKDSFCNGPKVVPNPSRLSTQI